MVSWAHTAGILIPFRATCERESAQGHCPIGLAQGWPPPSGRVLYVSRFSRRGISKGDEEVSYEIQPILAALARSNCWRIKAGRKTDERILRSMER